MIDYKVKLVERKDVKDFIEEHHYSKSINGVMASYCFGLFNNNDVMAGAMLYGKLGMTNAWKNTQTGLMVL